MNHLRNCIKLPVYRCNYTGNEQTEDEHEDTDQNADNNCRRMPILDFPGTDNDIDNRQDKVYSHAACENQKGWFGSFRDNYAMRIDIIHCDFQKTNLHVPNQARND